MEIFNITQSQQLIQILEMEYNRICTQIRWPVGIEKVAAFLAVRFKSKNLQCPIVSPIAK